MTDQLRAKMKAAIEAEIERQLGPLDKFGRHTFVDGSIDLEALAGAAAAIARDQVLDQAKAHADEEQRQAARRSREGGG